MNKRIVVSGISIVSALSLMVGSAFAAFTSSATNNGNTFGAGDLVLNINGAAGSASTKLFDVPSLAPGHSVSQVIVLKNSGSIDSVNTVLSSIEHNTTTSPYDLGDKLILQLIDDPNKDDTVVNGVVVDPGSADDVVRGNAAITNTAWNNIDLGFGLTAGAEHYVWAQVTFDPSADNNYQHAASTFGLNFQTSQ